MRLRQNIGEQKQITIEQVKLVECGLCGVRSRFIYNARVMFCEMVMYTRPTRLPNTERVKDALSPFVIPGGLVAHCESCSCCLGTSRSGSSIDFQALEVLRLYIEGVRG